MDAHKGFLLDHCDGPVSYTHLDVYKRQEEDADPEKDRLAAESIGEFTGDDGTADRANGRNGNDHALPHGGERVELGELFFRAGNDRCVKAEEQAAEGGDDGTSNDQWRNGGGWC